MVWLCEQENSTSIEMHTKRKRRRRKNTHNKRTETKKNTTTEEQEYEKRKRRRMSRKEIKQYSFIQQYTRTVNTQRAAWLREYVSVETPLSCFSICVCVSKFIHKSNQVCWFVNTPTISVNGSLSTLSAHIYVGILTALYNTHCVCYLSALFTLFSVISLRSYYSLYRAVFIRVLSANLRASYYIFIYPLFRFFLLQNIVFKWFQERRHKK